MRFLLALALLSDAPATVARCAAEADPERRVFELRRIGGGESQRWQLAMQSESAGASPVLLPLPDAAPVVAKGRLALDYRTLNGGRTVRWTIDAAGAASIDVYANYELEVNVEPDLDPRVDLMNTEGPLTAVSCVLTPGDR